MKLDRRDWLKTGLIASSAFALSSFNPESAGAKSSEVIRLTSNENPYGFSPKANQAILDSLKIGNRYAFVESVEALEKAIADREGLKPENVVLGSGSGEVLCMAGIAYGGEGKEIVSPNLTFPMLNRYAANFNTKINGIALNDKFEHDLSAMASAVNDKTSLVYVCNPNNPTGGMTPNDALRDFCRAMAKRTTVFADEAYLEYTDDFPRNSMTDLIKNGENVIVTRTFSKIYGMAGMRIGYGLAKTEIAQTLKKYRMTWFNALAINAALAAYGDRDFIAESKKKNAEVRQYLIGELSKMNMKIAPSDANFVWVNTGPSLRNLGDKMKEHNVLVSNPRPPFEDWGRVTIGTIDEMQAFVKALRAVKTN